MRLIKVVCPSCGAKLDVDNDKREFICDYCNTTSLLDDGTIRVEHVIKDENLDKKLEFFGNFFKGFGLMSIVPGIIFGVIFLIIVGVVVFNIIKFNSDDKVDNFHKGNEVSDNNGDVLSEMYTQIEVQMFNITFQNYVGRQSAFYVKALLNDVVTSNSDGRHIISVVYDGNSIVDSLEIMNISDTLDNTKEYVVSLGYDDYGFINIITIV